MIKPGKRDFWAEYVAYLENRGIIQIEEAGVYQCINCGAYASSISDIKHYASCRRGEGKTWKKFYEEANAEEEQYDKEEGI